MSCPCVFIHPLVIAMKAICKSWPGDAQGKPQDVPLCVRQMCGQMCHSWMLCELGHICLSSSCSPPRVEQEMAKGHSKKRDPFPAQEMHGLPEENKAAVPKDRSDEVLLILLFSPPGSEAR